MQDDDEDEDGVEAEEGEELEDGDPEDGDTGEDDEAGGRELGPVDANFRSGFVTVVGLPNAGKSTLINAFVGRAALITSYRPQTTRNQIRCIVTDKERQVIFVDTPGFIAGKAVFDKTLRQEIYKGKEDVDVLLYLIDATKPNREKNRNAWKALTRETRAKKVLVLNKIDKFSKVELIPLLADHLEAFSPDELVPVSAKDKTNLDALDRVISASIPRGPMLYPEDIVVDRPIEFLLSEFIREQLYFQLKEEIPFACIVQIESLKETDEKVEASAAIYVERDSQKGILIGQKGTMIARIRDKASARARAYFKPRKASISLVVKVKKNWRTDPDVMRILAEGE